jgi:hypothetical protein
MKLALNDLLGLGVAANFAVFESQGWQQDG